jgi:hypothetical protein
VKIIVTHPIYGRIVYDYGQAKITVQRGDLTERLTWLMKPKNEHLLGPGYHPYPFLRACQLLGIMQEGEATVEGEGPLPEGAVE